MKFLAKDLARCYTDFALVAKREKKSIVRMVARGFVKDMVAVTPPGSQGVTGTAAKKQGEAAIERDLAKILVVSTRPAASVDPTAIHKTQFVNGRIHKLSPRKRVSAAQLKALQTALKARVGFLASGWNAMAERLGVSVPAWVKRHGTRAGVVKVVEQGNSFRIEGINETAYVGNVKDYLRRIEYVMGYQAEKLDRQTKAILKKAAKQVGFKG